MPNSNRNIVIGVIVLIVVVLLAAWLVFRQGGLSGNTAALGDLNNGTTTSSTATSTPASLTVNDQFPGNIIYISEVTLPQGGWVVVRRNNNGALGDIIGVGYFDSTVHVGEVDLAAATVEGDKYVAILYKDNGDRRFTTVSDRPLLDAAGNQITSSFTVTRNLPERKG